MKNRTAIRPRLLGLAALAGLALGSAASACPGNANNDLVVDFQDLNIVLSQWLQNGNNLAGDVNDDNVVNFADLNVVVSHFNTSCVAASASLPNKTMIPATSTVVVATIQNTSNAQATFYWSVVKEEGEPTVTVANPTGQATIGAGATANINVGYTTGLNMQAGDDATMRFTIYSDAARTIVVDDDAGKVVVKPTGETTASNGWGTGDSRTVHRWTMTLGPAQTKFKGRDVTEEDPGGGGPDTCWFQGSAYNKFTAITSGTWTVGIANVWGDDWVGWFKPAVDYYRAQGRAPCSTQFPQDMHINGATYPKYRTNILKMGFSAGGNGSTTWSERDGVRETRNY